MKNYMDIVNLENKLLNRKAKLEEEYEKEMEAINKRLAEYEDYKKDFKNGNADLVLAKEYVEHYKRFNILNNFALYMNDLKKVLKENWKVLREKDLQLQDNAYGGDWTKYTNLVQKGYGTNYHPNLGSIEFSKNTPSEYFDKLYMELEDKEIHNLINVQGDEFDYRGRIPKHDPFTNAKWLKYKFTYELKTDKYDYTRLFKLLNFPEELIVTQDGKKIKYKLINNSYVYYTWNCAKDEWQNEYEEYLKMKGKYNNGLY